MEIAIKKSGHVRYTTRSEKIDCHSNIGNIVLPLKEKHTFRKRWYKYLKETKVLSNMSTHFSANQYDQAFAAKRLQNWQVPKRFKERPSTLEGFTRIISNDRGHILEGIPRSSKSPWGGFVGTWDMQKPPLKTETLKTKTMVEKINTKEKARTSLTKAIDKEIKTEEKAKTPFPTKGLAEDIKTEEKARTPSPTKLRTPSPQCASPVHGSPSPLNASPIKSPQQCTPSPQQSPQIACTPSPQQTPIDRKSPLQEA